MSGDVNLVNTIMARSCEGRTFPAASFNREHHTVFNLNGVARRSKSFWLIVEIERIKSANTSKCLRARQRRCLCGFEQKHKKSLT